MRSTPARRRDHPVSFLPGAVIAPGATGTKDVEVGASGDLDVATAWRLRQRVLAAADGCARVVLDAKDVTFVDAAGLGALAGMADELARRGVRLELANPSPPLCRLLALTGVPARLLLAVAPVQGSSPGA